MDNPTHSTKPAAISAVPVTPVKGSWEDLLFRGQQLVATQNQEGADILQSLIDRLARMPASTLSAGNYRLRDILVEAIDSVLPYLFYSQRYDEALANIELGEHIDDQTESTSWRNIQAMALMQSGAVDAAIDLLSDIAQTGEFGYWQFQVMEAIQRRRVDLAEKVIERAEHALNRYSAASENAAEVRRRRAILANCKAHVAAVQGKANEASAWMEYTLAQDAGYFSDLSAFYVRLVEQGEFAEALNWVKRDQGYPVRSNFWRGYLAYHLGKLEEADYRWQHALRFVLEEKDEEQEIDLLEYILAHYYLGDREGVGLGLTLNIMTPDKEISPLQFFLAGLGWAMRGNVTSAHANFQQAVMYLQSKALAHGLLPLWWRFCTDLIAEDAQPQYAKYFDLPETHSL